MFAVTTGGLTIQGGIISVGLSAFSGEAGPVQETIARFYKLATEPFSTLTLALSHTR